MPFVRATEWESNQCVDNSIYARIYPNIQSYASNRINAPIWQLSLTHFEHRLSVVALMKGLCLAHQFPTIFHNSTLYLTLPNSITTICFFYNQQLSPSTKSQNEPVCQLWLFLERWQFSCILQLTNINTLLMYHIYQFYCVAI